MYHTRTVPLVIPAPEVVCTWATVSSVNAMGTQTPANLRLASVRYGNVAYPVVKLQCMLNRDI